MTQTSDSRAPSSAGLPWWVRAADIIAVALIVLGAWELVTGGARGGLLRYIVSRHASAAEFFYAGGAVVLVRHLAAPTPSMLTRLRRVGEVPVWGPALGAFLATRLAVLLVAFFAVAAIGVERPGFRVSEGILPDLPARFDAGWYAGIATNGYEWSQTFGEQSNIAFFPAMPVLMRLVGAALGAQDRGRPEELRLLVVLWAGVLTSLAAFFFALWYLIKLGGGWIGEERSVHAAWLLACYPFAFVYSVPYTESLFLLASVAMVYHFGRSDWKTAAGWGLVVGLTRPNGFLLAVPLGLIALQRIWEGHRAGDTGWLRRGFTQLAVASAPIAGMLIFTSYLFSLTGVWFAWRRSHAAWGRAFEGWAPFEAVWTRLSRDGLLEVAQEFPYNTLNALGLLFALAMIWPVYRRLGAAWAAYVLISVAAPLFAGGLLSMGRLTAPLFPLFLALAAVIPSRTVPSWAVAFAVLQGLCAAIFFTWRPLY